MPNQLYLVTTTQPNPALYDEGLLESDLSILATFTDLKTAQDFVNNDPTITNDLYPIEYQITAVTPDQILKEPLTAEDLGPDEYSWS